jgi:small GTP-binding protein
MYKRGDKLLNGKYTVLEELGEGSYGVVYLVDEERAKKQRALKRVVCKGAQPSLLAEISQLARLEEVPHVLPYLTSERDQDGALILITRYMDSGNLCDYVKDKGTLGEEEALDVTRQIAVALRSAHKLGILHKDVKPQNVFGHQGEEDEITWYLGDWGLASAKDTSDSRTEQFSGTLEYIAPEVATGKRFLETDIYALGCTLYFMLTGTPPFTGNAAQVIEKHCEAEAEMPENFTPGVQNLLLSMLAKKPKDRPSAHYLVEFLEQGDVKERSIEPTTDVTGTPKKSFKDTYNGMQMPVFSGSDEPNREIIEAHIRSVKNLFRIALLGRVGAGKTALIRAMNSHYVGSVSAKAGETEDVVRIDWKESGIGEYNLQLVDTPGFSEAEGFTKESMAIDAAMECDLILFVIDADLSNTEVKYLSKMLAEGKRVIVVFNKCDLYSQTQRGEIRDSISAKLRKLKSKKDIVEVYAEARRVEVEIKNDEGSKRIEQREMPADVSKLVYRIRECVEREGKRLHKDTQKVLEKKIHAKCQVSHIDADKKRRVREMIDEQVREVFESGSVDPGVFRDILKRFNLNGLEKDIYKTLGFERKKSTFPLVAMCILAVERESENGNNPHFTKLQNPSYAAAKVVELVGRVTLELAVKPVSKKERKSIINDMVREVFY